MSYRLNYDNLELIYDYGNAGTWIKFTKIIEEKKSQWQKITIVSHDTLGKVLLLDDDLMGSEFDDSYDNAIISLIPPETKKVLILGGGDGSLASLLCQKQNIEKITVCDIDKEVFDMCQKHFKFKVNEKFNLVNANAFDYLTNHNSEYDLVVDDMIPIPHTSGENYWTNLAKQFKGKWVISQTDGLSNSSIPETIKKILTESGMEFKQISQHVPTYGGTWTFTRYRCF